ncbi:MAG: hypothetical protein LDL30_03450 [Desulfovibrio sp.]|nr:hypothetical protein [Desulfovibrio sp.]
MSIISRLSTESAYQVGLIDRQEYLRPQFRAGQVPLVADVSMTSQDVQNLVKRGFLAPPQSETGKHRKFSLRDVVAVRVIHDLAIEAKGDFTLAAALAETIAQRGEDVLAAGVNLVSAWEADEACVYYFAVHDDKITGAFLTREQLADAVTGKRTVPGIRGHVKSYIECDELLLLVLLSYLAQEYHA